MYKLATAAALTVALAGCAGQYTPHTPPPPGGYCTQVGVQFVCPGAPQSAYVQVLAPPAAQVQGTQLSPLSSTQGSEEIQIAKRGSSYYAPVRINDTITIPFHIDTGADDLAIPADVALTLIRAGALKRGDFVGQKPYQMANGSVEVNDVVLLREVRVGDHVVRNVRASITKAQGEPLLGQSFLSKFGSMTVDYNRSVLVLSR